jgi:formylglycine-generating enzyme required for sulfatase activity
MKPVLSKLLICSCLLLAACAGTPTPEPSVDSIMTRKKDGAEIVYVPAGIFQMGSVEGDPDTRRAEVPQHPVTLEAYWIDKHEVTNARYERCVEDGVCEKPSIVEIAPNFKGDDQPAVGVSWEDAETYCGWAQARLPTEAEWEYAARGPDGHIYPWGNEPPDDTLLNYDGNVGHTTEVGSYPSGASWVGALDMAGNASEWVNGWYAPGYDAASPAENPTGPDTVERKVLRGGSWFDYYMAARGAARFNLTPDIGETWFGFRCVVDP